MLRASRTLLHAASCWSHPLRFSPLRPVDTRVRPWQEPSNPLFAPCNCNGSIKWVHQDCLEAWLKHSGTESCELCKFTFHFTPRFAEDTPERLPLRVLLWTLAQRVALRWFPFAARICVAALLWLGVVPWSTWCVRRPGGPPPRPAPRPAFNRRDNRHSALTD